jgi:hypothetical protein
VLRDTSWSGEQQQRWQQEGGFSTQATEPLLQQLQPNWKRLWLWAGLVVANSGQRAAISKVAVAAVICQAWAAVHLFPSKA